MPEGRPPRGRPLPHRGGRHRDVALVLLRRRTTTPTNIGFGPLIAINEERVAPGAGYDEHHHADVEIVTWVLEGVLAHEDSTGQRGRGRPGTAQRLSAGTGVQHAERNASRTEPLRFVQMMLASAHVDEPEYARSRCPNPAC